MPRFNVFAIFVVAMYALFEWRGINLLPAPPHVRYPTARSSTGGGTYYGSPGGTSYRNYYPTTHGFHGGK